MLTAHKNYNKPAQTAKKTESKASQGVFDDELTQINKEQAIHQPLQPREKLVMYGGRSMADHELLAILLRTGTRGTSVVELALKLLLRFGNLRGVMRASIRQLTEIQGIGPAKATEIFALQEIFKRISQEKISSPSVSYNSPQQCARFLQDMLQEKRQECFSCLLLNNRFMMLGYKELFHGNQNSAPVYPGEVVRLALDYHAVNIVVAHNHPSGDAEPSQADIEMTKTLKTALELVEIHLVDHLVIGDQCYVSLSQRGLL